MTYDELIEIYISRFVNRLDIWSKQYITPDGCCIYLCQKPDMDTKGGKYPYESVTHDLVKRHINGALTCAWPAIDRNGCSKTLCFDSDIDDGGLEKIQEFSQECGLHVIREGGRPGRAGHLWACFDNPVPAEALMIVSGVILNCVGQQLKSSNCPDGVERFPGSVTGLTQVRGPLGIHRKPDASNCRGWFDGPEQDVTAQLQWLAEQPLNRAEDVIREANKHSKTLNSTARPFVREAGRSPRVNILELVDFRRVGEKLVAQCPICALEGHDQHRDNLQSTLDGSRFCCVFGGPGRVHKTGEIIKEVLSRPGVI